MKTTYEAQHTHKLKLPENEQIFLFKREEKTSILSATHNHLTIYIDQSQHRSRFCSFHRIDSFGWRKKRNAAIKYEYVSRCESECVLCICRLVWNEYFFWVPLLFATLAFLSFTVVVFLSTDSKQLNVIKSVRQLFIFVYGWFRKKDRKNHRFHQKKKNAQIRLCIRKSMLLSIFFSSS